MTEKRFLGKYRLKGKTRYLVQEWIEKSDGVNTLKYHFMCGLLLIVSIVVIAY